MALIVPLTVVGVMFVVKGEESDRQQGREALVRDLTAPGNTHSIASFLLRPDDVVGHPRMGPEDLALIERHLLTLPPGVLKSKHLPECLLLGSFTETSPVVGSSSFYTPALDALYGLYPKLKERSGFSPDDAPFYLRQRDRR